MKTITVTIPMEEPLYGYRLIDPQNPSTGHRSYKKGKATVTHFVVEIDAEKLVRAIGRKAIISKRKVSQIQNGAIKVHAEGYKEHIDEVQS